MATGERATRRAPAPARAPKPRPKRGAGPAVRVRMYRQGLGDCHLITFDPDGDPKHVLIDCGSLGSKTTGVEMAHVMENIRDTTNGRLELLIATHEHWDHVSGFLGQAETFADVHAQRVWMAWTEDPADAFAQKIAKTRKDLGVSLAAAAEVMQMPGRDLATAAMGRGVADVVGFFGEPLLGAAGSFSPKVNEAMDLVRKKPGATVTYLKPGELREESWLNGFRFYVLGPPRDEQALYDMGENGSSELYGLLAGLDAATSFHDPKTPDPAAAADPDALAEALAERERIEQQMPFDPRFRREIRASRGQPESSAYFAESERWRRIDGDWLRVASDLALQLDNATNNTSLVLAIERIADGLVLLFPGDAQQGNWLSWHHADLAFSVPGGNGHGTVRAADLLKRTVFYKVGHHASHNATLKAKGLELMEHPDMVAFIPVDRQVALTRHPQGSWRMPARPLFRRLLEKTGGRVARSDVGWAADAADATLKSVENEFADMATAAQWKDWARAQDEAVRSGRVHIDESKLFIEYRLT
jgi:hypothetical protein